MLGAHAGRSPAARPGSGGLGVLTCSGGDSGHRRRSRGRARHPAAAARRGNRRQAPRLLPEAATIANPLDYTSLIWAERQRLAAIAEAVGNDPAIDRSCWSSTTRPTGLADEARPGWEATRRGLADGAERSAAAPLFSSTLPDLIGEEEILELDGRGIAAVQGLGTAMRCVAALRRRPGDPARLREIAAAARGRSRRAPAPWLGEAEAKALLESAGVPVPERRIAVDAGGCGAPGGRAGWTRSRSSSPPPRSSTSPTSGRSPSASRTRRPSPPRLAACCRCPPPTGAELLVERMAADPGAELIVAARGDAVVPALVIGIGGIWTEVLEDVAVIPLPADAERIRAAIAALRGAPLLHGARGSEPVDVEAAAAAAASIGELARAERLALLEVNPLLVTAEGSLALDAVARR